MKLKLTYLFLIIIAILVGHYLGDACLGVSEPALRWLGMSIPLNLGPASLGLSAFKLTVSLDLSINFLQIFLIAIAVAMAPKVSDMIK